MKPLDPEAKKRAGDVCKSCRAEVLWATTRPKDPTKLGKPMPIDPDLVVGGNIALSVDDAGMMIARYVSPAPTVEAYVAHFTTCPHADEHRKAEAPGHDEQLGDKRRALQLVMPFGKYAGQTLEEIDRDRRGHEYLAWAARNLEFRNAELGAAVRLIAGVEP